MKTSVTYIYDGTFTGFLTTIFQVYEDKVEDVSIQPEYRQQASMFSESVRVISNSSSAARVWKAFKQKSSKTAATRVYYAFLSEFENVENILLNYFQYTFESDKLIDTDYSHPAVLAVSQYAKMVGREKHRMEAFVRFRLTKDQIYFATIEPDFNVLPIISKHFKSRYADQKWLIYDLNRKYGIYYDLQKVSYIQLDFSDKIEPSKTTLEFFDEQELEFQALWKCYFKHTNIESRKNMKLHIRHVPKRYWKYLSEKAPD